MSDSDECETRTIAPDEKYLSRVDNPAHQCEDIRQYVDLEADDGKILHVEKITSRVVYGQRYDVFDVRTETMRWWAITNMNNIYDQKMFPSMDMCLTFHIGFMSRMMGTDIEPDEVAETLLKTRRRIDAAQAALDDATEAEDFQAVGLQLREALLCFVRETAKPEMVPAKVDAPKTGDFIHWSELIIDFLTPNSNLGRVRSMLKNLCKDLWQVVNGLTHSTSADNVLGTISVDLAQTLISEFALLLRAVDDEPREQCPVCDSLRLFDEYRRNGEGQYQHFKLCEVCGWNRPVEEDRRDEEEVVE